MLNLSKGAIIGIFSLFFVGAYAMTNSGMGVGNIRNPQTVADIKKNCPDYYVERNGQCLRKTFRSIYVLHYYSGGGYGGGK